MERRRHADQKSAAAARQSQKSATAAQANYRRRRALCVAYMIVRRVKVYNTDCGVYND